MTDGTATKAFRQARDVLLGAYGQYDTALTDFEWPSFPDTFNWAIDWFDAIARGNDTTALWIVEEDGSEAKYSFDDMARRSDQVARWLESLGIGRGDSVILMLGNQVELWETMLAVMKLGAVLMPTTTAIGTVDLVDRVERGQARAVVANPSDAPKFDEVPGDYLRISVGDTDGWTNYHAAYDVQDPRPFESVTAPSDRLLMYFTSGTTSKPKLVEHTQVSYPVGHLTTMYFLGVKPGDVHLNISSPGWAKHAWSCFFAPWIAEATIFIYNYSRFDAKALLQQIRRAEVTTFCAPPTVWRMLIQADISGGKGALREAIGAGEPLNPEVISHVQKQWGLTIRDGFGQTETTTLVGNTPGAELKFGSMGRPLPGVPVVIVDPVTGTRADEGEICLDLAASPFNLMTGYLGDAERNEQVMSGGYYHTGDVASRDSDGYITYVGRTDDVFKASDYKVSPFELESVLIEHPAVAEAAVVPAPDETRLAVPKAYVSLAAGWEPNEDTASQILKYARENLAPYLRIRRIEFFELPKTISGKIRRVELRARENSGEVLTGEFRE
ncbi:AMP-binding protein [Rhodococcus sp. BP-252]|uniref:AMP-binding protein n=1 Tax=unclassified Rhodococcus (in: high G+C Gram-positive bacteria) TaxID=192944 RepID=UPI001C9A9A96|nr:MULTISPECIES: AMP-binding protein [unclassified Rhodococcus (in: high G+C Gram-positive bacteria)]MBY6412957.1 AMP-binding protein [Rhodococcus sp. BP-320]MBY6419441.1 AMP-binding protein [Rhodococcus sp. BP-321]MBY6423849.1 AMP-binding protein [Rhodococcus sp. BP-324]MBY6429141.1 AMP-binding protein [Rhodococcus sp. BP-323]MBY6432879.1 AMP-binding protein [Rhodococcus sp. BP-322]